ncbi:MAG: antitoxin VapB family protein [Candidatus Lokiarchaeia archaeon]
MTLKTIKINERIYKKLLDSKKDDESISEFLERLLDIKEQSKDINKSFGIWKDLPAEYFEIIESDIKEIREGINQRFS